MSEPDTPRTQDDLDATMKSQQQQQHRVLRSRTTRNNPMSGRPNVDMSFPELDLQMKYQQGGGSQGNVNYK